MDLKDKFAQSFSDSLAALCNHYDKKIDLLEKKIDNQNITIQHLKDRLTTLETEYSLLKEEFADYQSVSMVKNLTKQLSDKQNEIDMLNKKISKQPKVTKPEPEPEPEPDPEPEPEPEPEPDPEPEPQPENNAISDSEEEVEIDFIEKKLRGKIFLVTDDEDREIYEMLPDGEPGECVGKYNENNRPIFFKKN